MSQAHHLDRLDQRRRYLEARIAAKKSVGWDYAYDQDEHDALQWAVAQLQAAAELNALLCMVGAELRPWQSLRAKQLEDL